MNKFLSGLVLCFVMLSASLCNADFYTGTYDILEKYEQLSERFGLLDYGIDENDLPFAVIAPVDIYHPHTSVRRKFIDYLVSSYGLSREEASIINHAEYYYEFTSDGEKYALAHARFYENLSSSLSAVSGPLIYSYSVDESSKKFHETHNDSVMKEAVSIMSKKAKVFDKVKLSKKIDKNKRLTIKTKNED